MDIKLNFSKADGDGEIMHFTIDAVSVIWNNFLEGKADRDLTLVQLLLFLEKTGEEEKSYFCKMYDLSEIWNFIKENKNMYLNTKNSDKTNCDYINMLSVQFTILAIVILKENEKLMKICENSEIDVILEFFKLDNSTLNDSLLYILSSICSLRREAISYLVKKGIINIMTNVAVTGFYPTMLAHLSCVIIDGDDSVIKMIKRCISSDDGAIVEEGLNAMNVLISNEKNSFYKSIDAKEFIVDNLTRFIDFGSLSLHICSLMFLSLYDELSSRILDYILEIFTLILNSFNKKSETRAFVDLSYQNFTHFFTISTHLLLKHRIPWTERSKDVFDTISLLLRYQNYTIKKGICSVLVRYYDVSFGFPNNTIDVFLEFSSDRDLGAIIIPVLTRITQCFMGTGDFRLYLRKIYDMLIELLQNEKEEIAILAEDLIQKIEGSM